MDHQIRLRWTSHQGTMMSVFDALLTSECLVDVTLACEAQYIRAHKIILSACSPYFQTLINIDSTKHPIFFLKDVKFTELKALIQYMYRGEVSISQEDLPSLLEVAQALKIRGLADVETEKNTISSDTIIFPNHGTKNRVTMPPLSPPSPAAHITPPPSVVSTSTPMASPNFQTPRSYQHMQSHNSSVPSIPLVHTSAPPAKKSRMETHQPTQILTAGTVQKQSQMVDPLLDVVHSPNSMSSLVDPSQNDSASSSSIPNAALGHHGHSQHRTFRHPGILEGTEPVRTEVIKVETNGPIEIDVEEEENSMSHSSFSESWQMGEDDNSQMPDDDGELPGGSGNNDGTGAEGGELFVCKLCGKGYQRHQKAIFTQHILYDCKQIDPKFKCDVCGHFVRRRCGLKKHYHKHHPYEFVKKYFY